MGLGIPDNFEDKFPELQAKTLKWHTVCNSGTQINSTSSVSFFQTTQRSVLGNLILVPALATNSDVDPLMRCIQYWGLTHGYNVINIDTFLGDFNQDVSPEQLRNNNYPEFKNILTHSLRSVYSFTNNRHTCIIGHCVTTSSIIDILNDCVKKQEKMPVQSAMFFAPWPVITPLHFKSILLHRLQIEEEIKQTGIVDKNTKTKIQQMKYFYAMEHFVREIENIKFEPEIMSKWGIPASFIVASKDKFSPAQRIEQYINVLKSHKNANNFSYLYLQDKKHSFEQLACDVNSALKLLKLQRQQTK